MEHFRKLLSEHHDWPCKYLFKFVVPNEQESKVRELFLDNVTAEFSVRASKNGRFVSVSITADIESPERVIEIHTQASVIEGLLSL